MKQSESLKSFAPAFIAAQSQIEIALKDSQNPHFKSWYADLQEVSRVSRPHFNANGIGIIQSPGEYNKETMTLPVTTLLIHSSGEWMESTFAIPVSGHDPQKAIAAVTYARRSALAAMTGVVQGDDDGEEAAAPVRQAPAKKAPAPAQKAEDKAAQASELDQIVKDCVVAIGHCKNLTQLKSAYEAAFSEIKKLGGGEPELAKIRNIKDAMKSELQEAEKSEGDQLPM